MKVTFIFGNGFDLNLGMKSSYSQFYEWYCKEYGDEYFAKIISADTEGEKNNWSDLEEALGKYTDRLTKDDKNLYLDEKQNLEKRLKEYLIKESNEVKIDYASAGQKLRNALPNFYSFFDEYHIPEYKHFLSGTPSSIEYSMITLNYTEVLKKIYNEATKVVKPDMTHRANNGTIYTDKIVQPLYLHGCINSENNSNGMILGVADDTQIANVDFRDKRTCADYLIKQSVNRMMGARNEEKAKQIINDSVYVCVFGTSFGTTDKLLWQYLLTWLKQGNNKRLCIFARDNDLIDGLAQSLVRRKDYHRRLFLERGGVSDLEQDALMERIIVCLNTKAFDVL